MQDKRIRRPQGTGYVFEDYGNWYGQWRPRPGGRKIKRKLGPVRKPHSSDGLTKGMAEKRLRDLMSELAEPTVAVTERYTVEDVGKRHIAQLRILGRRENTLETYESYLRVHLSPYFQATPIHRITDEDIEQMIEDLLESGQAAKSVGNYLGLLHGIFKYAEKKRWVNSNPCRLVQRPHDPDEDQEIHFLDDAELAALLAATVASRYRHSAQTRQRAARVRTLRDVERQAWKAIAATVGCAESTAIYLYRCDPSATWVTDEKLRQLERVLYLTAAMSGLRQGELLALRWQDIDWLVGKIRVRRSRSRGRLGPTKSKRSSRAVPLLDELAGELERHYKRAAFKADDDLVFAHPHTGGPLGRSELRKRFKAALRAAAVKEIRFHDLRHTFGTRMAAGGVPMRTLQEWMGHRDIATTQKYADFAPSPHEVELAEGAWATGHLGGTLRITQDNSESESPAN